MKSILTKHQTKTITKSNIIEDRTKCDLVIDIRYDDQCGNGHNSFAITGNLFKAGGRGDNAHLAGGCIHEIIEKHAPELRPYIKWHFMNSGGPMYYIENTLYHARDTDYNGLKQGEYGAFVKTVMVEAKTNGEKVEIFNTGTMYLNRQNNPNLAKSNDREAKKLAIFLEGVKPELNPVVETIDCEYSKSKGKEIELKAARSCAIWPEATLEDFTKENLEARLPQLIKDFQEALKELDLVY